jgi:NAD(P)-dependent dehydrogenase (short-subunit alcohol dehydrogenase family)
MYDETRIGARLAGLFGLSGKVAVITGSAQGLGRETARLMAEAGAKVVIADLHADAARDAAAAIDAAGGTAMSCQVDVADAGSVKALFAAVDRQFGGVDILVNNAADRSKAEFFDMSVEEWDRMLAITLRGTFLCSREAIARMKAQGRGGAIVNISSVGSVHTTLWGLNAHYDAAKAGIDSLTRTLGGEFAADGIRVNSLLPGGMASEGGKAISTAYRIRGPIIGAGRVPMGRMAHPLEVAQAVLFLAGPGASYITGQVIAADGGFMVG